MMWHSRNISPRTDRLLHTLRRSGGVLLWVALLATHVWAGSATRTTFTLAGDGVTDSNMAVTAGGIGLGVQREAMIRILGDSMPGFSTISLYSDVASAGIDTFSFFSVDTVMHQVKVQGVRLQPNGSGAIGTAGKFCDITPARDCYLHVDRGANGFCASFVQKGAGARRYLRLSTGSTYKSIDSASSSGWLFPSQNTFSGDTFLVAASIDMNRIILRKVYARGMAISVIAEVTVATATASGVDYLMNCTVAADSNGTILVAWTQGSPNSNKMLHYRFFDADLTPGPSGSYAQPISQAAVFFYYDDMTVTSYGPNRFALVSWDGSGVLLYRLTRNGGTFQISSDRIISGAGKQFCTVSSNTRQLLVATKGDVDGNGIAGIEGLVYKLTNYSLGVPDTISFSIPTTATVTLDDFSTALNSTVDDSGSFGITWRHDQKAGGCVWSNRSIRYRSGFYTSPVESLSTGGDSIWFAPAAVNLSSSASWYTVDSLRTGASPSSCASAPWISFSDAAVLDGSRTQDPYYQYRITLNRASGGAIDSLTTPDLSSVTVTWNLQPGIDGVDSIVTGSRTWRGVQFDDTVTLLSRTDSAGLFLAAHDRDNGETVTIELSLPSTPARRTLSGGPGFTTVLTALPVAASDTVVPCSVTIEDDASWSGNERTVFLRSRNSVPQLQLRALVLDGGGGTDTFTCSRDTAVLVQAEDTVELFYTVADTNDDGTVRGYIEMSSERLDSTTAGSEAVFIMRADTATPNDSMRFTVRSVDPDTAIARKFGIVVNHPPRLAAIVVDGDTLEDGDTLPVVLDAKTVIIVSIDDTDMAFGDTIICRTASVSTPDTVRTTASICTLEVVPDTEDTLMQIFIRDRSNRIESRTLYLAFPWYAADSSENPGYTASVRQLAEGLSLIAGSTRGTSVKVPLVNTGRDRLYLTGMVTDRKQPAWLGLSLENADTVYAGEAISRTFSEPMGVEQGDTAILLLSFDASGSMGDSVECVKVVVFTNDPRHRTDTIPVCLEYNDLPRIVSVTPYFIAGQPYRRPAKRAAYRFPPHASISVSFSEPMDSAAALDGITLYSVFDTRASARITPLPLHCEWLQGYTTVHLVPQYSSASPAFGVLPPGGLFIPGDSLVLELSSALQDRATTPSGPNALDIDQNNRRDSGTDTAFGLRVDRIEFTVSAMEPSSDADEIARIPEITLTFSSPVYAASVDTSLRGNRSLTITSLFADGDTLPFRSVRVDSTRVTFTAASELFYRDSLTCHYSSRWILDRMGFATDNNGDGIDATLFDSLSRDDDLQWGYRIKTLAVESVFPDSSSTTKEVSPLVTIMFTDKLTRGIFDTDTSRANRSFRIGSLRTGWSSFSRIRIADDSMSVSLRPRVSFFSNDSVFCSFTGFQADYRYAHSSHLPDSGSAVFGDYEWSFKSGEIGFYTYPNPYKPRINPRHCTDGGPCGIWFKNLHTLGNGITEVAIAVFSQTAHPVFDSRKNGRRIQFGTGAEDELPQWLWDTRNNRGEPVATGLYLYAVYDGKGKVLQRGKIIIVR